MRTQRLFPLLLISSAFADDTPSLNGKWQFNLSAAGRDSQVQCSFTQKERELSGTCNGRGGVAELTGKVEGKKVTWTYKTDSEGGAVTLVYNGAFDATGKVKGTIVAVEFGVEGEFSGAPIR